MTRKEIEMGTEEERAEMVERILELHREIKLLEASGTSHLRSLAALFILPMGVVAVAIWSDKLWHPEDIVTISKFALLAVLGLATFTFWCKGFFSPICQFIARCLAVVWLTIVAIIIVDWWVWIPELRVIVTAYEEWVEPHGRMVYELVREIRPRHLR